MRLVFRAILPGASLLVLAACAPPEPKMAAPTISTTVAVDLGSSLRVPRIAGKFGEGEGYGTASQMASLDRAQMPGMDHGETKPKSPAPPMDHGSRPGLDHGGAKAANPPAAMDHSAMPGRGHSATGSQLAQADQAQVQGTGTVNSVDAATRKVNLSHSPIPAIGWPAMTMDFSVAPSVAMAALKPGTKVDFTMKRGNDGMYVIQSITAGHGDH